MNRVTKIGDLAEQHHTVYKYDSQFVVRATLNYEPLTYKSDFKVIHHLFLDFRNVSGHWHLAVHVYINLIYF